MCFSQEATFACGHNFINSLPCAQAEDTDRCRLGTTTISREDKGICPVCSEDAHERAEAEKKKEEDEDDDDDDDEDDDDDDGDDDDDDGDDDSDDKDKDKGENKGGKKPAFSGLTWEYSG